MFALKEDINRAKELVLTAVKNSYSSAFDYNYTVTQEDNSEVNAHIAKNDEKIACINLTFHFQDYDYYTEQLLSIDSLLYNIIHSDSKFWKDKTELQYINLEDCIIAVSNMSDPKLAKEIFISYNPNSDADLTIDVYLNKKE